MTSDRTRKVGPQSDDARALAEAAASGDAAAVKALLDAGVSADAVLPNGETALMRAAARGQEGTARLLLDAGADVNARRADDFTPLIFAAFFGHAGVSRLLLERGADRSATHRGTTAQTWAAARGFAEVSALVARAGEASAPAKRGQNSSPRALRSAPRPAGAPSARPTPGIPDRPARDPGRVDGVVSAAWARSAEASRVLGEGPGAGETGARAANGETAREPVRGRVSEAAARGGMFNAGVSSAAAGLETKPETERGPERGDAVPAERLMFASLQPARGRGSWPLAAGLVALAVVCASAVYAAWRGTQPDVRPAPVAVATPASEPQPAAPLTAATPGIEAQPSPDATLQMTPTASAPGVVGAGNPYVTNAPVYFPPVTNPRSGGPTAPALVSESGADSDDAAPAPRREREGESRGARGAVETQTPAAGPGPAETPRREADSRTGEQAPAAAPPVITVPSPRPSPTAPAEPTPTPRRRVIQWPPP